MRGCQVKVAWIVVGACLAVFAAGVALDRYGHGFGPWAGLARLVGGGRDLGPISFATLVRRTSPNDALVCPAQLCRAGSDVEAPVFGWPADELRRRLVAVALAEPRTAELYVGPTSDRRARFVQQSAMLRFPDVIDAEIVEIDPTHSSLALYSRSAFGYGDHGVNRARLVRWLAALAA
jgi:uncharacterized protein (DUF1499 family)